MLQFIKLDCVEESDITFIVEEYNDRGYSLNNSIKTRNKIFKGDQGYWDLEFIPRKCCN